MLSKPETCADCALCSTGKGFVPDLISPDEQYCFFGEAPGGTEIDVGKPFEGKAGFVLKNWLIRQVPTLQIALEKGKVSFRNILHCLPPDNKGRPYPTGETKRQAEEKCKQYHSEIKAHTVVLCGEVPQRFFFSAELEAEDASDKRLGHDLKGVMGRIGRIYERAYCNRCKNMVPQVTSATPGFCPSCNVEAPIRRWVFAPHPAFILRQPSLVQHGQRALEIATGEAKVVEPSYVNWDMTMEIINCKL